MLEMVKEEVWGVTSPCEGTRLRSCAGMVDPQSLQVRLPLSGLVDTSSLCTSLCLPCSSTCGYQLLERDVEREAGSPPGTYLERQPLWWRKWGSSRIGSSFLVRGMEEERNGEPSLTTLWVPWNHEWWLPLSPFELNRFQRSNIKNNTLLFGEGFIFSQASLISSHLLLTFRPTLEATFPLITL